MRLNTDSIPTHLLKNICITKRNTIAGPNINIKPFGLVFEQLIHNLILALLPIKVLRLSHFYQPSGNPLEISISAKSFVLRLPTRLAQNDIRQMPSLNETGDGISKKLRAFA